jgi:hypothetical protein
MPKSVQEYYRKCGFGHSRKRRCFNWNNYEFTGTVHEPVDAAVLGAYLHGLAADIALPETGHQSFIASDIINIWESIEYYKIKALKKGFKSLYFQFVKQINQFGF